MLCFEGPVAVVLTRRVGLYLRGHHNFGLLCRFLLNLNVCDRLPRAVPRSILVIRTSNHWTIHRALNLNASFFCRGQDAAIHTIRQLAGLLDRNKFTVATQCRFNYLKLVRFILHSAMKIANITGHAVPRRKEWDIEAH